MSNSLTVIQEIFQSSHFQILLKQRIEEIVETLNESKKVSCAFIPSIVSDIGDQLQHIIQFKVKSQFNQQYTSYLQNNLNLKNDVEELKVQLQKFNCSVSMNQVPSLFRIQTEQTLLPLKEQQKQARPINTLQMAKLRQQIESIRQSLQKVSHTKILEFVQETNLQLHKRIDQKYSKLEHEIHQMSQRNIDTSLDKTTSEILDLKYETLEQKLQGIIKNQKQLIDRFIILQNGIMEKYQTNFASVWNIIANIESNLRTSSHKKDKEKQKDLQLENLRSFVSPTARSSKKISFSNILSGLGLN